MNIGIMVVVGVGAIVGGYWLLRIEQELKKKGENQK